MTRSLPMLGALTAFVAIPIAAAQDPAMLHFEAAGPAPRMIAQPLQSPQGEVLYDTLWITDEGAANAGIGNGIGGSRAFPSLGTIDSQLADDFHLDSPHQITRVLVDCQSYFEGDGPDEGFWIQFYASDGDKPSETLYADAMVTEFTRESKGFIGQFETFRYTLELSSAEIVLDAGDWWMDVQPLDVADGGWFWSLSALDVDPPQGELAHVRDGWLAHGNSYYGLWGTTTWIEHNFRGHGTPARRIDGVEFAGFRLRLSGTCPGQQTLDIGGATPNGIIAILIAFQTGSYTIPGGQCQGAVLGLGAQGLRVAGLRRADGKGQLTVVRNAGTAACGRYLQALDGGTCATSNVVQIN